MYTAKQTKTKSFFEFFIPALLFIVLFTTLLAQITAFVMSEAKAEDLDRLGVVQTFQDAQEQVASLQFEAPGSVQVGDLVEIDCAGTTGASFKWMVEGIKEKNYKVIDGGSRLLLSADKAGEIEIVVATALADSVDMEKIVIVVESFQPETPDTALKRAIQDQLEKVNTPQKAEQKQRLKMGFITVAELIDVGALETVEQVIDSTKQVVESAVAPDEASWRRVITVIEDYLAELKESEKLTSMAAHSKAWREIANSI